MQTSTRWAGVALAVLLALGGAGGVAHAAHGGAAGGHHGGGFGGRGHGYGGFHHGHGFHHGPHVFIDGGFFFGFPPYGGYAPFYDDPYYYPYPPYPPDDGPDYGPPPEPDDETAPEEPTTPAPETSTYGLVRLRDVPDGAAVDLDGRFWLTASGLDDRWLALPAGRHTLAVRPKDGTPATFHVDVEPGGRQTIDFTNRD